MAGECLRSRCHLNGSSITWSPRRQHLQQNRRPHQVWAPRDESATPSPQKSHGSPHAVTLKGSEGGIAPSRGCIGPASSLKERHVGPVGSPCGPSLVWGRPYGHEPFEIRRFSKILSFLSTAPTGEVHAGSVRIGHTRGGFLGAAAVSRARARGPVSQRSGRTLYMPALRSFAMSSAMGRTCVARDSMFAAMRICRGRDAL